MKPETLKQRWEQHRRDGGKLTLDEFTLRTKSRKRERAPIPKSVRRELAADIFDDLPDGAFFAAAKDAFGLDPDNFV